MLTMLKNELNTLLEIKENPTLTQRSLSHCLNISLGLTNAILQNLIHRGVAISSRFPPPRRGRTKVGVNFYLEYISQKEFNKIYEEVKKIA